MAIVGPLGVLKLVREVGVGSIRAEAATPPRVVVAGTAEQRASLRDLLLAGSAEQSDRALLLQALAEVDLAAQGEEAIRGLSPQAVFVAEPASDALLRTGLPVFQVTDDAGMERAAERLAEMMDDQFIRMGRFIPALRLAMSDRVIASTSVANAEIALISALPGVVPTAQILLPPAAVADIVLLTKNQLMLVLKLAAMYGRSIDVAARLFELMPVVGGAFGWRALAREIVGAVPGGVGLVAKGSVAYAGTFTAGKAAQLFYAAGRHITPGEERHIYAEALERSRGIVNSILARLRRKPEAPGEDAA